MNGGERGRESEGGGGVREGPSDAGLVAGEGRLTMLVLWLSDGSVMGEGGLSDDR